MSGPANGVPRSGKDLRHVDTSDSRVFASYYGIHLSSRDSKTKGLPHSFYCCLFFKRLFSLPVSTKQIFVKICIWQLKTPWIVWLGLESGRAALCKWATYSYASDLPFKNFCKLAKQAETIRNYQKQVLVMINHCLWNSQINSTPE